MCMEMIGMMVMVVRLGLMPLLCTEIMLREIMESHGMGRGMTQ